MSIDYKSYLDYTLNNFLPKGSIQEKTGRGEKLWTADNWTAGVAECLMVGVDEYKNDMLPYKTYQRDLIIASKHKLSMLEILEKIKDDAEYLFMAEVGRGLDILIANSIKEWSGIYCYDHVNYEKYLKESFGDVVTFVQKKSISFDILDIKQKSIMIWSTNSTTPVTTLVERMGDSINKYIDCERIVHIILNGELIK